MNNGVNNTNETNNNINGGLAPMEGVKIAPAMEGPVNASTGDPGQAVSQIKTQGQGYTAQYQQPVPQAIPVPTPTQPPEPVIQQNSTPEPTPMPEPTSMPEPQLTPQNIVQPQEKKKAKINLIPILLFIVGLLGFFIIYSNRNHTQEMNQLRYNCTPVTASKEEVKLKIDSTLVQSLYNKVVTNIAEDLAQPEFNDQMKLYLAYRQILEKDKYDSNCNLFSLVAMEPYTCESSVNTLPKAFKEETLTQKLKEMFGENQPITLNNIQLGSTCIVGYQYIPQRGEFVEGTCNRKTATSFAVTKTLKSAISTRNTIILTEEVYYKSNEGIDLPAYLKNGTYHYTFRLDKNYNYVLVSKTLENKY